MVEPRIHIWQSNSNFTVPHPPTPVSHHPTPVPYHPAPAPHHPVPAVVPHHPVHGYNPHQSIAPVPLGYKTEVPVQYHELKAPHAAPGYQHLAYPRANPYQNRLPYGPYKPAPRYPPHYNPMYHQRRRHYYA